MSNESWFVTMPQYTLFSIYSIKCLSTGQHYIGITRDLQKRIDYHFHLLRKGKHANYLLQTAFREYGESAFTIKTLETDIPAKNAKKRERYWIFRYNSHINGFNLSRGGEVKYHNLASPDIDEIEHDEQWYLVRRKAMQEGKRWCVYGQHWEDESEFAEDETLGFPQRTDFCRSCRRVQAKKLKIAREILKKNKPSA